MTRVTRLHPAIGSAKVISFNVDNYGTVDYTGASASDAAVTAAIAARGSSPGNIEFGSGTVRLDSQTINCLYPDQGIRFNGTTIDWRGAGACIRQWDSTSPDDGVTTPGSAGPIVGGVWIKGDNNVNSNIYGMHVGDISRPHIEDVWITGFDNAGSIGFWGDNAQTWSERASIRLMVEDCTDCVVFEATGSSPVPSWAYSEFFLSVSPMPNQNGITIKGSTLFYGVTLHVVGNAGIDTTNTGALFTLGVGAGDTSRFEGELTIGVECGDSNLGPADFNMGPDAAIRSSYGAIFMEGAFQRGTATWNRIEFSGQVLTPSLAPVATAVAKGCSGVSGSLQPVRLLADGSYTHTISNGNVTQIAGTTIDGVSPAVGDRILVVGAPASTGAGTGYSTQPGNGIYVVTNNATNLTLIRAADLSGRVAPWNLSVAVREGSGWGGGYVVYWRGSGSFTWGTTALVGYSGYNRTMSGAFLESPVDTSAAQTLTNKRITKRIGTTTSTATPSINVDTTDQFNITALAAAITSITVTGTPTDGQELTIRYKDDGTARAITHGSSFVAGTAALLTTTVAGKTHLEKFLYDAVAGKWACILGGAVSTGGY